MRCRLITDLVAPDRGVVGRILTGSNVRKRGMTLNPLSPVINADDADGIRKLIGKEYKRGGPHPADYVAGVAEGPQSSGWPLRESRYCAWIPLRPAQT